jgi:hypothetical protein
LNPDRRQPHLHFEPAARARRRCPSVRLCAAGFPAQLA